MKIKVLQNQTLFDIAIQYYGKTEAVFDIALLNNIGITDVLYAGLELLLPDIDYGFKEVVTYLKNEKVIPATADNDSYLTLEYMLNQSFPNII